MEKDKFSGVKTFQAKIKELCLAIDKTQQDLAVALNLNYVSLSRKLNGKRKLSESDAKQIIRVLVEWEAINCCEEAVALLSLLRLPAFTEDEWQAQPLVRLLTTGASSTHLLLNGLDYGEKAINRELLPSHNLPKLLTAFVGRQTELAALSTLLIASDNTNSLAHKRLLTLVGVGGCGKTRLAIEVARSLLYHYKDGVWLVRFSEFNVAELVVEVVAEVLGINQEPYKTAQQSLIDFLSKKKVLLILDNCEHLLESTRTLAIALLTACPYLTILATSRESLQLTELETAFQVSPLSLPNYKIKAIQKKADGHHYIVGHNKHNPLHTNEQWEKLRSYDGIALFVNRAQQVQASFKLGRNNAAVTLEICQRLDGLPLALELAAARLNAISLQQISFQLNERFRLLNFANSEFANSPYNKHHQTLAAAIDWSYELLTPEEQLLLARISIFNGGFNLEAISTITIQHLPTDLNLSQQILLTTLQSLANKSLLVAEEIEICRDYSEKEVRYSLLETIQEYALVRLQELGEQNKLAQRHSRYYNDLAEQAASELLGANQSYWLARLEREYSNLRQALEWLLGCAALEETYILLNLISSLGFFWVIRGYFSEAGSWIEAVLTKLANTHNYPKDVIGVTENLDVLLLNRLGKFFHTTAMLSEVQGKYGEAKEWYEKSLELRRALRDEKGCANSLNNLGNIALYQGEYDQALQLYTQSLRLSEKLEDQIAITRALHNMGVVASRQGNYIKAQEFFEQDVVVCKQLNNSYTLAESLHNFGTVMQDQGSFEEAKKLFQESLELREELGDRRGIAHTLNNLATIAVYQEEYAQAEILFKQNLELVQEIEDNQAYIYYLIGQARLTEKLGEYQKAYELVQAGLKLSWELDDKQSLAILLEDLAWLLTQAQQLTKASCLFGAASELRLRISSPVIPVEVEQYQQRIGQVTEKLGAIEFKQNWLKGTQLSLEQLVTELTVQINPHNLI